jgi:hypothetical protein
MQDDAEKIVNAVIAAACNGDMTAAKIILDRIAPVRRSHSFDLPRIECPDDEVAARAAILSAVADGSLTPGEAVGISQLIEALVSGQDVPLEIEGLVEQPCLLFAG